MDRRSKAQHDDEQTFGQYHKSMAQDFSPGVDV
jgi:hypothetical protein